MKKILFVLAGITALTVAAELVWVDTAHAHFVWQKIPSFHLLLGGAGGLLLIAVSKILGKYWLYRPEDYYKD